jgi:hypothetical protein
MRVALDVTPIDQCNYLKTRLFSLAGLVIVVDKGMPPDTSKGEGDGSEWPCFAAAFRGDVRLLVPRRHASIEGSFQRPGGSTCSLSMTSGPITMA